MAASDGQTDTV